MCGGVHDVITGNKFHQNRLRGFRDTGVQNIGYSHWLGLSPLQQFSTTVLTVIGCRILGTVCLTVLCLLILLTRSKQG